MGLDKFSAALDLLKGFSVNLYVGVEIFKGTLLGVEADHLVLQNEDDYIYYYNIDKIQAITKNTKQYQSEEIGSRYLRTRSLFQLLNSLKHSWVRILCLNNQTFDGVITDVDSDFVTLISDEDRILIKLSHVSNIMKSFYSNKGTSDTTNQESQLNENPSQEQSSEIIDLNDEKTVEVSDNPSQVPSEEIPTLIEETTEELSNQPAFIQSEELPTLIGETIEELSGQSSFVSSEEIPTLIEETTEELSGQPSFVQSEELPTLIEETTEELSGQPSFVASEELPTLIGETTEELSGQPSFVASEELPTIIGETTEELSGQPSFVASEELPTIIDETTEELSGQPSFVQSEELPTLIEETTEELSGQPSFVQSEELPTIIDETTEELSGQPSLLQSEENTALSAETVVDISYQSPPILSENTLVTNSEEMLNDEHESALHNFLSPKSDYSWVWSNSIKSSDLDESSISIETNEVAEVPLILMDTETSITLVNHEPVHEDIELPKAISNEEVQMTIVTEDINSIQEENTENPTQEMPILEHNPELHLQLSIDPFEKTIWSNSVNVDPVNENIELPETNVVNSTVDAPIGSEINETLRIPENKTEDLSLEMSNLELEQELSIPSATAPTEPSDSSNNINLEPVNEIIELLETKDTNLTENTLLDNEIIVTNLSPEYSTEESPLEIQTLELVPELIIDADTEPAPFKEISVMENEVLPTAEPSAANEEPQKAEEIIEISDIKGLSSSDTQEKINPSDENNHVEILVNLLRNSPENETNILADDEIKMEKEPEKDIQTITKPVNTKVWLKSINNSVKQNDKISESKQVSSSKKTKEVTEQKKRSEKKKENSKSSKKAEEKVTNISTKQSSKENKNNVIEKSSTVKKEKDETKTSHQSTASKSKEAISNKTSEKNKNSEQSSDLQKKVITNLELEKNEENTSMQMNEEKRKVRFAGEPITKDSDVYYPVSYPAKDCSNRRNKSSRF